MKSYDSSSDFCRNLSLMHRRSQLSYEKFAKILGISKSNLQRIESGHSNINLDTLYVISSSLNLSPALLLTNLPQLLDEPVHQTYLNLLLLYYQLPADQRAGFLELLERLEGIDGECLFG